MSCFGVHNQLNQSKEGSDDSRLRLKADPFIKTKAVIGLNSDNFQAYLKDIDAVFVMFYDITDSQSQKAKTQVKKAAELNKLPTRAYAAVDCDIDASCCAMENVQSIPQFRIYTRGRVGDVFKCDPNKFLYKQMKEWVETFPVY